MGKFKLEKWSNTIMIAFTALGVLSTILIGFGSYKERFRLLEETNQKIPKALGDIQKLTERTDSIQKALVVVVADLATLKGRNHAKK